MGSTVLVIIGAGASCDLIPYHAGKGLSIGWFDDHMQKPPLTQDVFRDDAVTKQILDRYQGARNLAATIRLELIQNDRQLEPLLREYRDATGQPLASQFVEIPLYLQDLFAAVSKFTNQPTNYQRLAQVLFSDASGIEKVVFVTLNYETLLDDVLFSDFFGYQRTAMDSYTGDRCMLVKLHGSVNWVRKLKWSSRLATMNLASYLAAVRSLGFAQLKSNVTPEIEFRPPNSKGVRWGGGRMNESGDYDFTLFYPALSVPLGDYDPYFACPAEHIEALKNVLPECSAVIAIGTSARDGDLLGLLKEHLGSVGLLYVVDSGTEATEGTYVRLRDVPQLARTFGERFGNGFSHFILNGGPERFVEALR